MDLAFKSPGTTSKAKHHTAVGPARTPIVTGLLPRDAHRAAHTDVATLSILTIILVSVSASARVRIFHVPVGDNVGLTVVRCGRSLLCLFTFNIFVIYTTV